MKINKCLSCSEYTLLEKCKCGSVTVTSHPPKFSPEKEEKWGKYRRLGKTI